MVSGDARAADAASADGAPVQAVDGFIEGGGCSCYAAAGDQAPKGTAFWLLLGLAAIVIRRRR